MARLSGSHFPRRPVRAGRKRKLTVQFFYDMPEAPCQFSAGWGAGDADYGELYAHGFGVGGAAVPVSWTATASSSNRARVSYNARRDKRGLDDADYPRTYRITNLPFTVYGGTLAGDENAALFRARRRQRAPRHSVPIDRHLAPGQNAVPRHPPGVETRRLAAGARAVPRRRPPRTAPKKARAKRNVPDPRPPLPEPRPF